MKIFTDGICKPNPAIFRHALDLLKQKPSEIVHIGDTFDADIQGALNLGMKAVWLSDKENPENYSLPLEKFKKFPSITQFYEWVKNELQ